MVVSPYESTVQILSTATDKFFSVKVGSSKRYKEPYLVQKARRNLRRIQKMWNIAHLSPDEKGRIIANTYQARVDKRRALATYEKHKAEKQWNYWVHSPNGVPAKLGKFLMAVKWDPVRHILLWDSLNRPLVNEEQITIELERGWKLVYLERFWDNMDMHRNMYHSPLLHPIHYSCSDYLTSDITHDEVLVAIRSLKYGTSAGFSDILPETI